MAGSDATPNCSAKHLYMLAQSSELLSHRPALTKQGAPASEWLWSGPGLVIAVMSLPRDGSDRSKESRGHHGGEADRSRMPAGRGSGPSKDPVVGDSRWSQSAGCRPERRVNGAVVRLHRQRSRPSCDCVSDQTSSGRIRSPAQPGSPRGVARNSKTDPSGQAWDHLGVLLMIAAGQDSGRARSSPGLRFTTVYCWHLGQK